MSLGEGQKLAVTQLEEIAVVSNGAVTIESVTTPADDVSRAKFEISLSTRHLKTCPGGLPIRARERFIIHVAQNFPLRPPSVYSAHKRFAGFPHVQWSDYLCLYQAPEFEWRPADGIFGLIDRLNDWLRAAALGELDPDNAPLHPPAQYPSSSVNVVCRANTPAQPGNGLWIGAAHFDKASDARIDLVGWSSLEDDENGALVPGSMRGAAVLLAEPLPFEYPKTTYDLIMAVHERGFSLSLLFKLMRLYTFALAEGEPLYVVIGAPMRRVAADAPLCHHIAVWRVAPDAAAHLRQSLSNTEEGDAAHQAFIKWAASAGTEWCCVFEDRPEVTLRRDDATVAAALRGKRVLLLGCGALGTFLGEYLVRGGVSRLVLVDSKLVAPGILVRQLHEENWVGRSKSLALAERLKRIGLPIEIEAHVKDLSYGVFTAFETDSLDLIIDATASPTVSFILEQELPGLKQAAPLLSLSISARAEYGMATVRKGGFSGGSVDITRRAKLAAMRRPQLKPVVKAFWPAAGDMELFQPEPGCSDPTFVGSAIDMAYYSSGLLHLALERLKELGNDEASADYLGRPGAKTGALSGGHVFTAPACLDEQRYAYRVLASPEAERQINANIREGARLRGATVETGGLMFGTIDDSLRKIWIDSVTGPPPDSFMSDDKFICGVEGTKEIAAARKQASGASSAFVGIWHTHPVSDPDPSNDDLKAMAQLLLKQEKSPRHVVMLIIGNATSAPLPKYYLYRRAEYLRIIAALALAKEMHHVQVA